MATVAELTKSLESALHFIEVQQAYKGAMTAAQVEAAIVQNQNIAVVQIAANSVTTLASFNIHKARELIAAVKDYQRPQPIQATPRASLKDRQRS